DLTAGNPLFLNEIVRDLVVQGRVAQPIELVRNGHPGGVREAIIRHIGVLSSGSSAVLGAAAVIGQQFAFTVLEAVVRDSREALTAAVDEAVATRILVAEL